MGKGYGKASQKKVIGNNEFWKFSQTLSLSRKCKLKQNKL